MSADHKKKEMICYFCAGLIGILIFLRGFWLTGFDGMAGSPEDGRFNLVIMEHWWRFFQGRESWLSPNFFYPVQHTLGYSDALILYALPYSVLRLASLNMFTAYQVMIILLMAFGYAGMVWFLRAGIKLSPFAATFGALIGIFSNCLFVSSMHTQMFSICFIPWLAMLLLRLLSAENRQDNQAYGISFAVLLAMFFYTSYYCGWFFLFYLLIMLSVSIVIPKRRGDFPVWPKWSITNEEIRGLLWPVLAFLVAMIPFYVTYLPVFLETGGHNFSELLSMLPKPIDLINVGRQNMVWSFFLGQTMSDLAARPMFWELQKGVPLMTLLAFIGMILGMFRHKDLDSKNRLAILLGVSVIAIWLLLFKIGDFSLWHLIYRLVPGASGIRAVYRFNLVLTLAISTVLAIGLDSLRERLRGHRAIFILYLCCFLICLEQFNTSNMMQFSKTEQLRMLADVPDLPVGRSVILLNTERVLDQLAFTNLQVDGMLIAQHLNVATLNGYSGNFPQDWWGINGFSRPGENLYRPLAVWIREKEVNPESVFVFDIDDQTWRPYRDVEVKPAVYHLGEAIDFSQDGNGNQYLLEGWSQPEADFTWSDNAEATVAMVIPSQSGLLKLTLEMRPYTPQGLTQKISILVNGVFCGAWSVQEAGIYSIDIPGKLSKDGTMKITFLIPGSRSPKSVGESDDRRLLGMAVNTLRLDKIEDYNLRRNEK